MATSTQIPVEEYLRTSYDPDCEYVDGEVLDRNVGRKRHSKVQARLISFLMAHAKGFGIFTLPEWRMRTGETRYRVPHVVIVAGPEPDEEVLSTPPLVCIEILSPEDRMSRVLNKVAEYLTFGVRYVWVLNPESKEAFVYTANGMEKITDGFLRTESPAIEIPLAEIFD
jgi:Uma2 family endonuclease